MTRQIATLIVVSFALRAVAGCQPANAEPPRPGIAAVGSKENPAAAPAPSLPAPAGPLPARASAAPAAPGIPPVPRANARRFAGSGLDEEFILQQLAVSEPLSFKPVGSTSTVFRARLSGPVNAAFKSVTVDRPLGPLAEVAAYRLSRCLALDTVPPACSRTLPASVIRDGLEPDARADWPAIEQRMGVGDDGMVQGAAIYWIPDLTDIGLDGKDGERIALGWLNGNGELPESRRSLAASLSTMFGFDYLIGNFDRWSGGNVRGDAHAQHVYLRDHDHAFPGRMREQLHRRLWREVSQVERFSRSFYARLRALDRGCFDRELAADKQAATHLSERQIRGVFDRRKALLSHIDALIALRGADQVLVFE